MRQRVVVGRWLVGGVLLLAALVAASPASPQFTSFSRDPRNVLEGSWESCRGDDGQYAERVYDHVVRGAGRFEVHLGPADEFAIFPGVQAQHREHGSAENLLMPYRVPIDGGRAKRRWEIPSLGLAFTVTLAGGSRPECDSWFILLEPLPKATH